MEINKGEIVGLIGRNGAGKSTLMKLMAKSLKPTSGLITYNGVDINSKDNVLTDFGIMIDPVFYPEMSVIDNLKFYLRLHGKEELFSNIEPTLKLVELWKARNRKPKGFSFGMKQRTALAIAMVAEPDFLILDEPESNLDMKNQIRIIEAIKHINVNKKSACIINTHFPSHALQISDKTLFIGSDYKTTFDESSKAITEDNLQKYFQIKAKILIFQAEEVEYKTVAPYKAI